MLEVGQVYVAGGQEGLCIHYSQSENLYMLYFPFGEVARYALYRPDGGFYSDAEFMITKKHYLDEKEISAQPLLEPPAQRAPFGVPMRSEDRLVGENIWLRNTLKFFATPDVYREQSHFECMPENYRDTAITLWGEEEMHRRFVPVVEDGLRLAQRVLRMEAGEHVE